MNKSLWGVLIAVVFTANVAFGGPIDDAAKTDVMIEAGDVTLGATLYRPAGTSGDLPVIITAHGSAPSTRDGVGFYTHHALKLGFAVVSFDKRGTGKSCGTYRPFDVATSDDVFRALARDVAYAVRWAKRQPGINTAHIGLFGGSQAGWIMPLAAKMEAVDFIIIGEGVHVTAYEEDLHGDVSGEAEWNLAAILRADVALRAADMTVDQGYDPAPVLWALDIPVLWLFGLRDPVIPVAPSIERLESLIKAGKTNHDIYVFPFGDHNFLNVSTGKRYDVRGVAGRWLKDRGLMAGN